MWGYTKIGVAIDGRVRVFYLCSAFTPFFTGGLVLDLSERTNQALVVEVILFILPTKWLA